MNRTILVSICLVLGFALTLTAQSSSQPSKVGIINIQQAIAGTQEGQKAATELQQRYEPKRLELEKKQAEIQALRDQLSRGSNTMSDEAKRTIANDIDAKTKAWNRDTEDASADFQTDQDRILSGFFEKMQVVIDKYARDNGYTLILDISSQASPVIYATLSADITNDIIALYDKNSPAAASPAKPAAAPAAKPPAAAPAKK